MPSYRLTYFNGPGRAEPIRIALFMGDVQFEDHRLNFQEFMAAKQEGAFPLGSVPVFEVDQQKFTQTAAILRYVAKIGDTSLYPGDPAAALVVDSALDTLNDTLAHAMTPSFLERDQEKKLAMRAEYVAGPMTQGYTYVEQLLCCHDGPFLAGETMSIADLVVAGSIMHIRSGGLDGVTTEHLAPFPKINALTDAYLAHPQVAAYLGR